VLTGAGISVPSGIPDFRTPRTGLWANVDPMEIAHIDAWRADPARFWAFYGQRFQSLRDKRPNRAHEVLVELERRGLIDAVVTQNIDRLHERAGSGAARPAGDGNGRDGELIELHGTIAHSSCLTCGVRHPLDAVQARLEADPDGVPRCDCGHPLKPDVVLFGELLPQAALERAQALASRADLLLCIGSSLEVYPVGELPALTLRAGGEVAIVTQGRTRYDRDAVVKLDGDVVAELEALLAALP
jgi:NAD-dependent protein deacetylase/lipoamidase